MHHKFALFDGARLATGSYSWTRSAWAANHENIIVLAEPPLLRRFAEVFEGLWRSLS
jgi:mitochondrial cardiolipin hydrolase